MASNQNAKVQFQASQVNGVGASSQSSTTARASSSTHSAGSTAHPASSSTQGAHSTTSQALNDTANISWLELSWQLPDNRFERITTGVPRMSMAVIGQNLLQHHLDLAPGFWTAADFVPVRSGDGGYLGAREKLPTWPLTRKEVMRHKSW